MTRYRSRRYLYFCNYNLTYCICYNCRQ